MAKDREYRLYSWGANSYGQLGVKDTEDSALPKIVSSSECISLEEVRQIAGGGGHTVLLTSAGKMFVCGWNKNGQLGLSVVDAMVLTLSPVPSLTERVQKVSCGWNHTLALLENGHVVACGCNTFGQLGVPEIEKQTNKFTAVSPEVFSGCSVVDIAAGLRHSVATTDGGQLYSWGDGRKGQLGHGRSSVCVERCPATVQCSGKCTVVRAGAYHSVAIAADGSLLSWGLNQHGQCGVDVMQDTLAERYGGDNFKCSPTGHITNIYVPMVVEAAREVLTWGRCDYGQLGREVPYVAAGPVHFDSVPRAVPSLVGVKQLECGSEHNIAITGDGRVASFGWNEHGMCGSGDEVNVMELRDTVLTASSGELGVLLGAGAGHSMALVKLEAS